MSAREKTRVRRAGGGARDTGRQAARKAGRDAQKPARPRVPFNRFFTLDQASYSGFQHASFALAPPLHACMNAPGRKQWLRREIYYHRTFEEH